MSIYPYAFPASDEYAPYYETYIRLAPETDILDALAAQLDTTFALLASLTDAQATYAYAEGKWTVKEVIGHVVDSERVFAYRALRFARGDRTELPGFEQDDYIRNGNFASRSVESLSTEFGHLRRSNIALFASWDGEIHSRGGVANGNPMTVRAIPFILAGHERHHLNVLKERYFPEMPE